MDKMNATFDPLFLIDTNILAYAYNTSDEDKHNICVDLLDKCWKGEVKYAISVQNLSEFYFVVTKKIKYPVEKDVAEKIVKGIIEFNGWIVINYTKNTVLRAIEINKKYNLHFFDALLAATMQENGIFKIYTEDKDFKKVQWLEVSNPLEK